MMLGIPSKSTERMNSESTNSEKPMDDITLLKLKCVLCHKTRLIIYWLDVVSPVCVPCWVRSVFKELDTQEIEYTEKKA